jgi:20S proteasome alpha/beta subunit
LSIDEAIALGNKAMERALDEGPLVETGIVTVKDGVFRKLTNTQS